MSRTLVATLQGWCSAVELIGHVWCCLWVSNPRPWDYFTASLSPSWSGLSLLPRGKSRVKPLHIVSRRYLARDWHMFPLSFPRISGIFTYISLYKAPNCQKSPALPTELRQHIVRRRSRRLTFYHLLISVCGCQASLSIKMTAFRSHFNSSRKGGHACHLFWEPFVLL